MLNRYANLIRIGSVVVIVAALMLLARALPLEAGVEWLKSWVEEMGVWGPVVFGLIYVVAVILMSPAWILTVAAGAVFGLWIGTLTVSLASTTGAALAFLIARYLARHRVEAFAKRYPKFHAVDRAIGEGGWKVVAMLRLSPALPFNLQNYFYGLTAVRFWPAILASWIAMLPGTFMYVYFGYIARAGAESAATDGEWGPARWTLLIVGLVATVAVTVYVTRLANRKIKEQTHMDSETEAREAKQDEAPRKTRPAGAVALAVVALLLLSTSIYANMRPNLFNRLFGPPKVEMKEAYEAKAEGPTFDHSAYEDLLKQYVREGGWIDYAALMNERDQLQAYINAIAQAPFDEMGRDEKLALLINAYNAFTLELILEYWNGGELESIKDIPADKRWDHERWQVGNHTWSLNQIEHEQIRPRFAEPRIHFALVCAAYSCPPLRREAYTADKLDDQLEDQTVYVHNHDRWYRFDAAANTVHLTALYDWYGDDFKQAAGSVLEYVAQYAPAVEQALEQGNKPEIKWIDYSWALNSVANAPKSE